MVPSIEGNRDIGGALIMGRRPVEMESRVSIRTGGLNILGQGQDRIYRHLRNQKELSVIVDVGKR